MPHPTPSALREIATLISNHRAMTGREPWRIAIGEEFKARMAMEIRPGVGSHEIDSEWRQCVIWGVEIQINPWLGDCCAVIDTARDEDDRADEFIPFPDTQLDIAPSQTEPSRGVLQEMRARLDQLITHEITGGLVPREETSLAYLALRFGPIADPRPLRKIPDTLRELIAGDGIAP